MLRDFLQVSKRDSFALNVARLDNDFAWEGRIGQVSDGPCFESSLLVVVAAAGRNRSGCRRKTILRAERSSSGDLEVGGDLAGLAPGSTRYVRYEDLLQLPQETYSVSDDSNFRGTTEIGGVALSALAQILGQSADMIVAICYDRYRTNYPADYLSAHHPLLVLRINGKERDHWPTSAEGGPMAPYLISHPVFKPSFKVLSHEDEPQIPYGVTRIEFRREAEVFGPIRPPGGGRRTRRWSRDMSSPGRIAFAATTWDRKAGPWRGHSWLATGGDSAIDEPRFRHTIRDPHP